MVKILYFQIALTLSFIFGSSIYDKIRYIGYLKGCYDATVNITRDLNEQGVNAQMSTDVEKYCKEDYDKTK